MLRASGLLDYRNFAKPSSNRSNYLSVEISRSRNNCTNYMSKINPLDYRKIRIKNRRNNKQTIRGISITAPTYRTRICDLSLYCKSLSTLHSNKYKLSNLLFAIDAECRKCRCRILRIERKPMRLARGETEIHY